MGKVIIDVDGYVQDVPDIRRPPPPKRNRRLQVGEKPERLVSSQELAWKLKGNQRPVNIPGHLWPGSPILMALIKLCN